MVSRVQQIEGWLAPAGEQIAAAEVASMFAVMSVKGMGDDEADAMMAVYVSDLADLPYFALSGACRQYRRGQLGDGKWAPTPGEICQAARRLMDAPLAEKSDLNAILAAEVQRPVIGPDRRAELLAEKDALLASLSGKNAMIAALDARKCSDPKRRDDVAEKILADLERRRAEYAANPVGLSAEARSTVPTMEEMREII